MADIKLKDINKLETWNPKELRKLKITLQNRIASLGASKNIKALPETHPLFEMEEDDCKNLLGKVLKEEKNK